MERKRLISLVGGLCLTMIGTVGGKAQEVYITVENKSTEDVFLQPEDTTGYRKVLPGTTIRKPVVDGACYYRFVDANSNFYSLYVERETRWNYCMTGKNFLGAVRKLGYRLFWTNIVI